MWRSQSKRNFEPDLYDSWLGLESDSSHFFSDWDSVSSHHVQWLPLDIRNSSLGLRHNTKDLDSDSRFEDTNTSLFIIAFFE